MTKTSAQSGNSPFNASLHRFSNCIGNCLSSWGMCFLLEHANMKQIGKMSVRARLRRESSFSVHYRERIAIL